MQECNFSKKFIDFFIFFYLIIIAILIYITPFTYSEANILYALSFNLAYFIVNLFDKIGHEPYILRLPFFVISIINLFLYKKILERYFKKGDKYYNLSILFFLLTPGIFLSFLLVNYATIPIFLTLFLIYSYYKNSVTIVIFSLVLLFFTHSAQFVVYIALILFGYKIKNWIIAISSSVLMLFASVESTYPIDGVPKGHLLQLFGIYAAIFSPLLFLASVYTLYKAALNNKKDLLWYITATAFIVSVILSIRQKIKITDFSPYFIIITPLVVNIFRNSVEIRLKEFRKSYYRVCKIIFMVLLLETFTIVMHYPIYKLYPKSGLIIDDSIYKMPKIVNLLKKNGKKCKKNISYKEKNLYKYYNIYPCE